MRTITVEIPEERAITEELSRESMCEIVEKVLMVLRNFKAETKHELIVVQENGNLYMKFECVIERLKLTICKPQMH